MLLRSGVVIVLMVLMMKVMKSRQYFKPYEFHGWYDQLNPDLLRKLNLFRYYWGAPVNISGNHNAVGRHLGLNDDSSHNVDRWGEVNAVDIFPEGMNTADDMKRAEAIARKVGFTGIGLYTDTSKPMMHVDVRPNRTADNPATWARVGFEYVGIDQAYV